MPEPIEEVYVELTARADKLIAECKRARDQAKKALEEIKEPTKELEGTFIRLARTITDAFDIVGLIDFGRILKRIGITVAAIVGAVAAIAGYATSLAMGYESVVVVFNRLLGSEQKSAEFMAVIEEQAALTGQSIMETASSAKKFLPYAEGSAEAFQDMLRAAQGLAAADPLRGMVGAASALREFLAGTYASLVLQYGLPKEKLRGILEQHKDIEGRMKALNKLLEQYGMGFGLASEQAGTLAGQMGVLGSIGQKAFLEMGIIIRDELKVHISDLIEYVEENKEEIIALAKEFGILISVAITGVRDIIDAFLDLGKAIGVIKEKGSPFEWVTDTLLNFRRLGFIIEFEINEALRVTLARINILVETIQRLRRGEGLIPAEEVRAMMTAGRRERALELLEKWRLLPEEEREAKAPPPAKPPPEEEVLSEKAKKAMLMGAKKIEAILKDFQKRVVKLTKDHGKKLATINTKEQKDTEKALEKHNKSIEKTRKDHYESQKREQKDFNREWKCLIRDQYQEVLDAEWEFQYEEERLIAEGDTLALRDLRIRYQHEKDIRAREQDDARADMQENRGKERVERERDFQDQLSEMQTQLADQLQTIADNAVEARAKERENYEERLVDLKATRDEKLQAVGEGLMSEEEMNLNTANTIMEIWAKVYGAEYMTQVQKGIEADQARKESLGLLEQQARETAQAIEEVVDSEAEAHRTPMRYRVRVPSMPISGYEEHEARRLTAYAQHGLDAIFNRPTSLVVGEGGVAEHVRVTPLAGGRGGGRQVDVNLSGNITVSGDALSSEAANVLIIKMAESVTEGIARRAE